MKKLIFLLFIAITTLVIVSCDSTEDPVTPDPPGNLGVTSNPAGAQIWIDGTNTGQVTPDTVTGLDEGLYSVTLKLTDFEDTTITSISVTSGQTSVLGPVVLTSNINTTFFGGTPIRIYESFGTSSSEPSGIDLSSGMAYGISGANQTLVDIYYYSDASGTSFLVQSAHLHGLVRRTDFLVGSSTDIYDGVDSPLRGTGTWATGIDDTENNYVFLYDHDGNYSKLRIVGRGGGVPGVPAYLDVQWYYNNDVLDERFK